MTMTRDEFLSAMKSRGAFIAPAATPQQITNTNSVLQHIRAAILPMFMIEFFATTSGISLDSGYIFGPNEFDNGPRTPVPNVIDINREFGTLPGTSGKTIFGRNDLFLFAFDTFGVCYMLDNLSLRVLRKYDDPYRAMTDCLIAGKY